MIHECNAQRNSIGKYIDHFKCRACNFEGNLTNAVEHVVANQFKVEYKAPKKAAFKSPQVDNRTFVR